MQCNACGNALDQDVKNVVLPCLHIFCLDCAQKQLESDSTCVQCGAMFSHKSVKGVQVLQDANKHLLTLCGQTPEVIMQSALTAINCYNKQVEIVGSLRESKLQRRMELLHAQCNDKLQQVHAAYTKAKIKTTTLASQLAEANADKEELHSKYQQRVSQVKQLKEQIRSLQQQKQQGQGGQGQGQLGMVGGNLLGGGNFTGGSRPGRSMSPPGSGPFNGGGGHVVTTMQRTQFFNLSDGGGADMPMQQRNSSSMQAMLGGSAAELSPPGLMLGHMQMQSMGGGVQKHKRPSGHEGGMQLGSNMKQGGGMGGGMGGNMRRLSAGGGGMAGILQPSNKINLNLGSPSPF